jgi:catechol 2,3-dioxygenase-like lactoylglutathione lyase family enzyme
MLFLNSKKLVMLADKKLTAFAPTVNQAAAKKFYGDILGLTLLSEDNYALVFDANGTVLRVTNVRELKPQEFTVLGWHIEDISSTIKALNGKGVFCEKYNFIPQDDLGVWTAPGGTKVAWFKDPDGNILSLTE